MSRKNEAITISCSPTEKSSLEDLAKKYDYMWGDRPNISALIKAIANHEIPLGKTTPERKLRAKIRTLETRLKEEKAKLVE